MNGQLFTQDFLTQGITTTPVWEQLSDSVVDAFAANIASIYLPHKVSSGINEAVTDDQIIQKVLACLAWHDASLPQINASAKRREDIPDWLLFPDEETKAAALKESKDDRRYPHGIAILEAKRWMRPLDRGDATDKLDPGTPSNQMLRYLSISDVASNGKVRWGILTNGAVWRLYFQGARSRSEDFLEINLAETVGGQGFPAWSSEVSQRHVQKVFFCFFHRAAFLTQTWDKGGRSFHEYAIGEARNYEEKVSQDLGARVFATVFPDLASALAANDPKAPKPLTRAYLDEVREATLILLYRLLFVLYAEDRLLLPVRDGRYYEYSLHKLRNAIREMRDTGGTPSATAVRLWNSLSDLFHAISSGDASLGLPAYNGGLFDDSRAPLLKRARVPDAQLASVIDEISRRSEDVSHAWINYRDLSVQHLGSIYERLLEYKLESGDGKLIARPTSFARKVSGSYYTHDDLVKLLIAETLGPLIKERRAAYAAQVEDFKGKRELKPGDWAVLDGLDLASRILDLKVCDPAMGSGHFLVSLVDYLADAILEGMDFAADTAMHHAWGKVVAEAGRPHRSPLIARIDDIRNRILATAKKEGWAVADEQLDDRHIVRRMILKRVIFGVDKNPMAVELAKVALWLHTFTVGAPLSFLDHHLRCGDALHGETPDRVIAELDKFGAMHLQGELSALAGARAAMHAIEELTDANIAEARESKTYFDQQTIEVTRIAPLLDFWRSCRWLFPKWPIKKFDKDNIQHRGLAHLLGGHQDLVTALRTGEIEGEGPDVPAAIGLLRQTRKLAERERFFHWPLSFPTVFGDGVKGFDAVIGNPPWDRMKLQEVEWFAERREEIAKTSRASDRKRMIDALKKKGDSLYDDYLEASEAAEANVRVARECGDYPLLSGGDVNLYSLFIERASHLTHSNGVVGLLCPSGIAADKGAAEFFGGISGTGRLVSLFDFENRKIFFPDVHASFKFCTLVFGGLQRKVESARCAFYLRNIDELKNEDRLLHLKAQDFLAVNPNTGSAPIFRTRRDAAITTAIYQRQPVFVDRREETKDTAPIKVWPARYVRMFDMTNDSNLFLKRDELEKMGWYPVDGNHWKKSDALAVPLYEGKMVQMFDHRAANVVINQGNLKRPAQQEAVAFEDHVNPKFCPTPQFWVADSEVKKQHEGKWGFAYKSITAPTNMRTMIASIVPECGVGNSMAMLLPSDGDIGQADWVLLLLANISSFAYDFVLRQKVQGQNLNWYVVEQTPLIRPEQFQAKLGKHVIADFVREQVLRLSYTAWDLKSFAMDMGYDGPPFRWDEEDRRHRLARLDALFFHLYAINKDDAAYILDTFPIVREHDEKAFGRFRTKELILAYMNAVAAGDLTTKVNG